MLFSTEMRRPCPIRTHFFDHKDASRPLSFSLHCSCLCCTLTHTQSPAPNARTRYHTWPAPHNPSHCMLASNSLCSTCTCDVLCGFSTVDLAQTALPSPAHFVLSRTLIARGFWHMSTDTMPTPGNLL